MKLARGLSAFSSLQQLCRPKYIHAGVADTLGGAGGYDEREVSVDRSVFTCVCVCVCACVRVCARWLRYMRLVSSAYGWYYMCPHTSLCVCVRILSLLKLLQTLALWLRYMRLSSSADGCYYICVRIPLCVSSC